MSDLGSDFPISQLFGYATEFDTQESQDILGETRKQSIILYPNQLKRIDIRSDYTTLREIFKGDYTIYKVKVEDKIIYCT